MPPKVDSAKLEQIVEPVVRAHGLELVQLAVVGERTGAVLRVLIDREGSELGSGHGVSLGDCQSVSRDLGTALDVNDAVPGNYRLEVSSPGLDRPLVKLADFARFAGREVKVQTKHPLPDGRGGERRNFTGQLVGINGEAVRFTVDGNELELPHAEIAKANVVHRFD